MYTTSSHLLPVPALQPLPSFVQADPMPSDLDTPRVILHYARTFIRPLSRLGAMPSPYEIIDNRHDAFLRAVYRQYPGGFSQLSEDLGLVYYHKWHISNFLSLLRIKGSSDRHLMIHLLQQLAPVIVELDTHSSQCGVLKINNLPSPLHDFAWLPATCGCLYGLLDRLGEQQGRVVDLIHDVEIVG